MAIETHSDQYGTAMTIDADRHSIPIEVFESQRFITLRQENGLEYADVLQITVGQAYDLLTALSVMLSAPDLDLI